MRRLQFHAGRCNRLSRCRPTISSQFRRSPIRVRRGRRRQNRLLRLLTFPARDCLDLPLRRRTPARPARRLIRRGNLNHRFLAKAQHPTDFHGSGVQNHRFLAEVFLDRGQGFGHACCAIGLELHAMPSLAISESILPSGAANAAIPTSSHQPANGPPVSTRPLSGITPDPSTPSPILHAIPVGQPPLWRIGGQHFTPPPLDYSSPARPAAPAAPPARATRSPPPPPPRCTQAPPRLADAVRATA